MTNTPAPPGDWAAIRAAYETSSDGLSALSRRFGVFHINIYTRAKMEGWLRPEMPAPAAPAAPAPPAAPPDPDKPKPRKPRRQGMIDRLYRVIDNNLSQLEDIMRNQSDPSIADNEKETRTIGTVIGNIEKLKGLESDAGKSTARAGNKSIGPIADNAETERVGRDLAERILRLTRKHGT